MKDCLTLMIISITRDTDEQGTIAVLKEHAIKWRGTEKRPLSLLMHILFSMEFM